MRVLLSNDDGYRAPGIQFLATTLAKLAEVIVVAPDRDRSGSSHALTIAVPVRPRRAPNGFIYVDGTPTDCVHLAITGLLETPPDVVIAGINSGANLGDDVMYSGTVAAAMEGRDLGLPALAVSLVLNGGEHYETAARVVTTLLERLPDSPIPRDTFLNINVPDRPWEALRGIEITRLGRRHKAEPVVRALDPRGEPVYWVGAPGSEQDAGPGTDFHALREGRVSVTPLHADLTRHSALADATRWIAGIEMQ